jgi:hypothetical protein
MGGHGGCHERGDERDAQQGGHAVTFSGYRMWESNKKKEIGV